MQLMDPEGTCCRRRKNTIEILGSEKLTAIMDEEGYNTSRGTMGTASMNARQPIIREEQEDEEEKKKKKKSMV